MDCGISLVVGVIANDVLVQMRSTLLPGQPWEEMVDMFFYREPEETKEPGEEDAADYGADQGYNALPAPGGKFHFFSFVLYSMPMLLASHLRCVIQHANNACLVSRLKSGWLLAFYFSCDVCPVGNVSGVSVYTQSSWLAK